MFCLYFNMIKMHHYSQINLIETDFVNKLNDLHTKCLGCNNYNLFKKFLCPFCAGLMCNWGTGQLAAWALNPVSPWLTGTGWLNDWSKHDKCHSPLPASVFPFPVQLLSLTSLIASTWREPRSHCMGSPWSLFFSFLKGLKRRVKAELVVSRWHPG